VLRLPLLLSRKISALFSSSEKKEAQATAHWSTLAERGSGWGMRFIFHCYRLLGARALHFLLYPIVAYFFIAAGEKRAASLAYFRQLQSFKAQGRENNQGHPNDALKPGWLTSFRHMLAFAQSGLDKLAAWSGQITHHQVEFPQRADFDQLIASGKGAILIGSHLGNLEMARALARGVEGNEGQGSQESKGNQENQKRNEPNEKAQQGQPIVKVNAVVYTGNAKRFNSVLARANADFGVSLIQVPSLGPDTAMMLKEKVDDGELLVIVGDRTPPAQNGRVSTAQFLGRPAPFAQGPFVLASLLECPVYLFFCLREKKGYRIYFELFADRVTLPRQQRQASLQDYIQRYAQRLEFYCLHAPLQWFNFFDFWQLESTKEAGKETVKNEGKDKEIKKGPLT